MPLAAPGIPDAFLGDLMTRLVPGVPPLNDWKDSPFCIGHPAGVRADWNGLPDGVLALPAAAPAKADWIRTLRIRYPTVAALDLAWGVSATSFETLRWPGDAKATAAARRDLADFRGRFADWLYLTMGQAIRFSDNAHMIFGVCVVPGVTPPEVAATIAKRTDVVVVEIANAEAGLPAVAKLAVELGRPLYVVAGVAAAAGPAELPAAWSRAMERLAAIPGVVGAEIADYLPNADGTSFVHWDDIPEITLTEAARRTNARLLRIHAEGHAEGHI